MHELPFDLSDVVVFLAAAGILAPALHRLGLSQVVTFLLVGVAVGPYGLARFAEAAPWLEYVTIESVEPARAFAEIGVVLLLFLIGLELSARRLWAMRRLVFGLGGAHVLLCAAAVGGTAAVLTARPAESFVVGAALALSSTAIVLQLVAERGQLGSHAGRTTLSILLMQDLAVVPILLFVSLLGGEGGPDDGPIARTLLEAAAVAVLVIGAIMAVGRLGARPLLRLVRASRSPEMFAASVLLLIVATAAATQAAGLSLALGAFLAGLLLAETEYRHEIDVLLSPLKGLFLGLFFLSVGMGLDLVDARAAAGPLLLALAGLLIVKSAIGVGLARVFGLAWPAAVETAVLLASGGEFAFVVVSSALDVSVISDDAASFISLLAGLSMVCAPALAALARWLAIALERKLATDAQPPVTGVEPLEGHVVIVGYGRVGRMLGDLLCQEGIAFVALDSDPELIARARRDGAAAYVGDARNIELLDRLATDRAAALAVTMDSSVAAEAVVSGVRRVWPNLPMYARARDREHAARLVRLGAQRVTPETLEASLDLAQAVLEGAGLGAEAAHAVVDARRSAELEHVTRDVQP